MKILFIVFNHQLKKYNMLKKIFKLLNKSKQLPAPPDEVKTTSNKYTYEIISEKLNNYFFNNYEKEKYSKELEFINNGISNLPEEEKVLYTVLPYPFTLDYDYNKIEVLRDEQEGMFYVYLNDKKLYYHRGLSEIDVQKSFTFISAEQDINSPHRYLDKIFTVNTGDVVADIGAAEGNFSLMVVGIVKELIIVEADPIWMEALHKTFEPWKSKVRIINKFAGQINDENTVTIDKLEGENKINVIKMDIEGAEVDVLKTAENYISNNKIKMAVTTYHKHTDAEQIKTILEKNNYQTQFSKGYMLFIYDKLIPPFFRHGLIKANN